jgi:hypothetical protein
VAWAEEVEGSGGGGAPTTLASSWMADGRDVDGGLELRRLTAAEGAGAPAVAQKGWGLLQRGSCGADGAPRRAYMACFFFMRGIGMLWLWSCVGRKRVCEFFVGGLH